MEMLKSNKVLRWMRANWVFVGFLGIIVGAFVVFRTTPSELSSADELSAVIYNGKPTVIEFYSNF